MEPKVTCEEEHDQILYAKAQQFAKIKMMRQIAFQVLTNQLEDGTLAFDSVDATKALQEINDHALNKEHKSQIFLMTVNPQDGVSFVRFRDLCLKAMKKTWIKDYMYSFEQRADTDEWHGWHMHALIGRPEDKKPSQIRKEFLSTFKEVIGNAKALNFQFRKMDAFTTMAHYILGDKQEDKLPKSREDIAWRVSVGVNPYYCGGAFSGPYV